MRASTRSSFGRKFPEFLRLGIPPNASALSTPGLEVEGQALHVRAFEWWPEQPVFSEQLPGRIVQESELAGRTERPWHRRSGNILLPLGSTDPGEGS